MYKIHATYSIKRFINISQVIDKGFSVYNIDKT